jgi:hypothetical protein
VQGGDQFDDRCGGRREPALEEGGEVLNVGHGDDRRLGLGIEVRAPGQQRVVDHVDGDLVLLAILGRREQPAARRASVVGSALAGCGAGHRA